ncbi:MAG: phosphatidylserine decarboxylase [Thermoanaerobaculia bacterium]
MRIAKEAWPFVLPFAVASIVLAFAAGVFWSLAAAVLGLGVLLFFRDPARSFDGDADWVIAPADGLVTGVETVADPAIGEGRFQRVVTFLSAFDVHVQRTPVDGEVVASSFASGRKVAAFRADAGEVNECHTTVIRRASGDLIGVRQIVGLMARRVVCYLRSGQTVERGQHLGIIKFGSRVDLLVPESYEVVVKPGDRVRNGATPMARPCSTETCSTETRSTAAAPAGER